MTKKEGASKRKQALLERLGSEEAVSQYYRDLQKKSMLNPNKQKGNFKGGFKNKPELAKIMSEKALKARWGKNDSVAEMDKGL